MKDKVYRSRDTAQSARESAVDQVARRCISSLRNGLGWASCGFRQHRQQRCPIDSVWREVRLASEECRGVSRKGLVKLEQ